MAEISFEVFKSGHELILCSICFCVVPPHKQPDHARWHDKLDLERENG